MRVRGSDDSMSQSSRDQTRRESLASYTRRVVTASDNEAAYRIIQRLRAARLGLAAVPFESRRRFR